MGSLTSKGTVNVSSPLIIAFAIRCCNVIVVSIRCSQCIRGRTGLAVVRLVILKSVCAGSLKALAAGLRLMLVS